MDFANHCPGRCRILIILCACLLVVGPMRAAEDASSPVRNVLFIVSDDLRAGVLGCYGDTICRTPHLDRLAARSVVFERAYCQGTVCAPSRRSFMYSRYQGVGTATIGEHFREAGRYTARVGKIFHMRVPGDIIAGTDGQDVRACWTERFNSPGQEAHTPGDYACLNLNLFTTKAEGRQSTKMPHRMFVSVQYDGDGSDQPDHRTATKTIQLLREHQQEPFLIAAGFVRPHYPMVAPRQYFAPYQPEDMLLPKQLEGDLDDIPALGQPRSRSSTNGIAQYPQNQKRMWAAYYAAVSFMDEQLGRILTELDRLKLSDSTVIVFTSDHGYHLGDHTFWLKNNLHEHVIRVPLMIAAPGITAGRTEALTELVDLYPTLCELTSLPIPDELDGESLLPILQDPSRPGKTGVVSFDRAGVSWRTRDWAFMHYEDGSQELYDMRSDPDQFSNLARDPAYKELKTELEQQLFQRLSE